MLVLQKQIMGSEVVAGMHIQLPAHDQIYPGHLVYVSSVLPKLEWPADCLVMLNVDHPDPRVGRIAVTLIADKPVFMYSNTGEVEHMRVATPEALDWFSSLTSGEGEEN